MCAGRKDNRPRSGEDVGQLRERFVDVVGSRSVLLLTTTFNDDQLTISPQ